MRDSPDPAFHRSAQQRFVAHVQRLLEDPQLQIETASGMVPVTSLIRNVTPGDDAVGIKRKMVELNLFDRDLQRQMPQGLKLDVALVHATMFGGRTAAGNLRVLCLTPADALLKGQSPMPLSAADVSRV